MSMRPLPKRSSIARGALAFHTTDSTVPHSSRIDGGEGSCVLRCRTVDADFLVTDDVRALPELRQLVAADVALSPILLRALVDRGVFDEKEARDRLETVTETRSWPDAPIYRRAVTLFEDG